jgi:hypothetical protein
MVVLPVGSLLALVVATAPANMILLQEAVQLVRNSFIFLSCVVPFFAVPYYMAYMYHKKDSPGN